jgi:hypothetical protein
MNLFEFLAQAGFWQWVGFISLVGVVSAGFANVVSTIRKG